MESEPKVLLFVLLTIGVGSYGGLKLMSTAPAENASAAPKVEEVATAQIAPQVPPPVEEPGVTVSYQIQACVDDKAVLTLQGDKIMWNEMTGEGLGSAGCSESTRSRTSVLVRNSVDGSSESMVVNDPKSDVFYGKLHTPIPSQELLAPADVQILYAGDATGRVTVVEQPTGPRYRTRLLFDDAKAYAHEYVVLLTLKYRATAALGAH